MITCLFVLAGAKILSAICHRAKTNPQHVVEKIGMIFFLSLVCHRLFEKMIKTQHINKLPPPVLK
jgi:hypothetical protein